VGASEAGKRASGGAPLAVRRATGADAPGIAALHVRAWQWAYRGLLPGPYLDGLTQQVAEREAMWRQILGRGDAAHPVWIAELDGRIAGFCNTSPAPGDHPDTAQVQTLYLEPEVVGTGVGAALMGHLLTDLRSRGVRAAILWVLDANLRARRFYERGGWRPDGTTRVEAFRGAPVLEVRYRIDLDGARPPAGPPPG
jgi:GNAT superfamily N-acetyltransferase